LRKVDSEQKFNLILTFPIASPSMPTEPNDHQPNIANINVVNPAVTAADFWVETLKTIGLSVALALGMRTFVAEARFIPSGSMEPTLQIDDRLIIDKVSYRFSDPQRGDIVVFDPTAQLEKEHYKDAFIKRVIGLPGDVVEVHNDRVKIDGKPLKENYPSTVHPDQMTEIYAKKQQQDPSSEPWSPDAPAGRDWQGTVPAGQYLVLGDNRNNSYDGRSWGFVPKNKIVGRAIVKFWPLNRTGLIEPQPAYRK
jgi:signal peptidase I